MRCHIVIICCLLSSAPSSGAENIALTSRVESGWTSNAAEVSGGRPDLYVMQSHALELSGASSGLALRAGLALEETRFRAQGEENDLSLTGGVEMGLTPAEGLALRLGYAQSRSWTGDLLELGTLRLGITNPLIEHEAIAELVLSGAGRQLTLGMDGLWRQPGTARFSGLALPDLRLDPEAGLITLRADGEWALATDLAALARVQGFFSHVPWPDRVEYGRQPADGARLAAGLRLSQGAAWAELVAGLDMVWPQGAPALRRSLPYVEGRAELALMETLTLNAGAATGLDLLEPIDGVASSTVEARLGMRLALAEALALTASWKAESERGLYDAGLGQFRWLVGAGIVYQAAKGVEVGLSASHERVTAMDERYGISRIAATMAGHI